MKILIISNRSSGLYEFRLDLIKDLIIKGVDLYLATPFDSYIEELKSTGAKLIETKLDRRGINPFTDLGLFKRYMSLIRKIKPDKVITYTIKPNVYGGVACALNRISYYCNVTGLGTAFQGDGMLKKLVTLMYKVSMKKAKCVFFENPGNRDVLCDLNVIKKEQSHVLNGAGVNLEKFKFAAYPNDGVIHFIFIGRVMKEKGIDELFEAAKRLHNEYNNVEIDVLGRFEDNYEEVIAELDEQGCINYIGFQKDVRPFIEKAHCFVLPSYHEGMANTLLECGAMGRPLITSNIHGCLEAVEDGKTGYLCKVKDANDLYVKMKKFIELPYADKVKMGQASHELVAGKFDKRKVVEETVREIMR